jgi:hypothetical protein
MAAPYVSPNPLTGRYEDAAHRIADDVNTVLVNEGFDVAGDWMIFGLDDGKPAKDNAAWRHKHYPSPTAAIFDWRSLRSAILVQIPTSGANPKDVAAWLKMNRQAHDNGYRINNGTYEPDPQLLSMPLNREDFHR